MRRSTRLLVPRSLLLTCLVPSLAAGAAGAAEWSSTPLTINGLDRPVAEVLREVISAGGLHADVPARLRGTVSGTLQQRPREAFVRLVEAYNLQWWRDGDIIHVVPMSDTLTRSFDVAPLDGAKALALLRRLDLLNRHLPHASSGALLRISGPAPYLSAVAEALDNARRQQATTADEPAGQPVIRVFPLRYARASDLSYDNGEQRVSIPGVASLVSDLLGGPALPVTLAMPPEPSSSAAWSEPVDPAAAAASAFPLETPATASAAGRAIAHGQSNAVLVRAPASMMRGIERAIAQLDVPQQSVEIEATIIDIASDEQRDLGVEWLGLGARVGSGQMTLGSEETGGFIARVRALEARGKARVLSQPRIHTLNNTEAVIASVQRMYVRVASERDAELFGMDAGLRLRVLPSLGAPGDPMVQLAINLKDGTLDSANTVDGIPTLQDHSIATQAAIAEGSSLLIGGYTLRRDSSSTRRVPWLSRIPVLGWLFRSRQTREERFQRIVMITPRLPEPKSTVAALSPRRREERQ